MKKATKNSPLSKKSKLLISLSVFLFALSPIALVYSSNLFYWLECKSGGVGPYYNGTGWGYCGGLGWVYIIYAIALASALALVGCLLLVVAIRSSKK